MVVEIGPQYPLHSGASSRSILAFLPQDFIDDAVRRPSSPAGRRRRRLPGPARRGARVRATRPPSTNAAPAPLASRRPSSTPTVTCWVRSAPRGRPSRYSADVDERHETHARQVMRPRDDDHGPAPSRRRADDRPGRGTVLPRSFLYVPASRPDLFDKAARRRGGRHRARPRGRRPAAAKDEAREQLRSWLEAGPARCGRRSGSASSAEFSGRGPVAAVHPALTGSSSPRPRPTSGAGRRRAGAARGRARCGTASAWSRLVETAATLVGPADAGAPPAGPTFGVGEVDLLADLRVRPHPRDRGGARRAPARDRAARCRGGTGGARSRPPRPTSATSRRSQRSPGIWSTWASARVRRCTRPGAGHQRGACTRPGDRGPGRS